MRSELLGPGKVEVVVALTLLLLLNSLTFLHPQTGAFDRIISCIEISKIAACLHTPTVLHVRTQKKKSVHLPRETTASAPSLSSFQAPHRRSPPLSERKAGNHQSCSLTSLWLGLEEVRFKVFVGDYVPGVNVISGGTKSRQLGALA